MEMFVLSYVNVLSIYPRLWLQLDLRNGSEPTCQRSMLYSDIVPRNYVNETICIVICLSTRFKSIVLWPGYESSGAKIIPKYILWMRGLMPFSEFQDTPFFH